MIDKKEQYLLDQLVMIDHLQEYGMYYEFISMGKLWELTSVAYSVLERNNLLNKELIEQLKLIHHERDLDNDSYLQDLKNQVHDN